MTQQAGVLYRRWMAGLAVFTNLLFAGTACAGSLTVSPIMVEFSAKETAQGLWLSNSGNQPMRAQLRAYAWSQADGTDALQPTQDLLLSPPMLELGAGQQQLVRVIRTGANTPREQSYRILVDELPDPARPQHKGLNFVMQFSVPVFVVAADQNKGAVAAAPLDWRVADDNGKWILTAANNGTQRAQVADFELLDAKGQALQQQPGLLGYVLPGVTRRWSLPLSAAQAAAATAIQGRINGEPVRQDLHAENRPR